MRGFRSRKLACERKRPQADDLHRAIFRSFRRAVRADGMESGCEAGPTRAATSRRTLNIKATRSSIIRAKTEGAIRRKFEHQSRQGTPISIRRFKTSCSENSSRSKRPETKNPIRKPDTAHLHAFVIFCSNAAD